MDFADLLRQKKAEEDKQSQQTQDGSESFADVLRQKKAEEEGTVQDRAREAAGKAVNALTGGLGKVKKAFAVGSGGTPTSTPPAQQSSPVPPGWPVQTTSPQQVARRNDLMKRLEQIQNDAAYITDPLAANENKAQERDIINQLNSMDAAEGKNARYYNNADRFAGSIAGAALNQGAAYSGALGTVSQLAGVQDAAGRAIADSPYAGYVTDPVTEAAFRSDAENGRDLGSAGILDTNKRITQSAFAAADRLGAKSGAYTSRALQNADSIERFGVNATQGAFDLVTDAIINFFLPGSGMIMMGTRAFGSGANEARASGLDENQQLLAGVKSASIELATEKMFGPFEKIYGKTFFGKASKKALGKITNKNVRIALKLVSDFLGEDAEEVISGIANPVADRLLGLSKEDWSFLKDEKFWSDTLYEGFVGGMLGVFGGAANVMANGGVPTPQEIQQIKADGAAAATEAVDSKINDKLMNKPVVKNVPKNSVQNRVATLVQQAQSQTDLARVLEFIADDPALAQSFKEVYGIEAEDHLMKVIGEAAGMSPQEPAGANMAQENAPAPANTENTQQKAPGEFNSENRADESREQAEAPVQPVQQVPVQQPQQQPAPVQQTQEDEYDWDDGSGAEYVPDSQSKRAELAQKNKDLLGQEFSRADFDEDAEAEVGNSQSSVPYTAVDALAGKNPRATQQAQTEAASQADEASAEPEPENQSVKPEQNPKPNERRKARWEIELEQFEAELAESKKQRAKVENGLKAYQKVRRDGVDAAIRLYPDLAKISYEDLMAYAEAVMNEMAGVWTLKRTRGGDPIKYIGYQATGSSPKHAASFELQHPDEASRIRNMLEERFGGELRAAAAKDASSVDESGALNNGSEVSDVRETPDARSAADFLIDNDSAPEQHEAYEVYGAGRDGVYRRRVNSATRGENRSGTVRTENPLDFYAANDVRDSSNLDNARRRFAEDAELKNRRLANEGLTQEQRDAAKKEASKAELVRVAREQVKGSWLNLSRIQDGVDEWASVSAYDRADILNEITGDDYYVSGGTRESGSGEVVRARRSVKSDTDQRSSDFYSAEMKEAGIEDVSAAQLREGDAIARAEAKGKIYKDEDAPADHVGTRPNGYSQRELAGRARDARQRELYNKRQGREKAKEEKFGGKAVENKVLGKPNTELQSSFLQRIMRDEARLKDLINGEGEFSDANDKAFGIGVRFDMLRAMYPDANFYIDTNTNSIRIAGTEGMFSKAEREAAAQFGFTPEQLKQNQQAADDRKRGVDQANIERLQSNLENGGTENEIPRPPQESSSRTFGRGRVTTAQALFRSVFKAYNRYRTDNLRGNRNAGGDRGGPAQNRRGNEKRNLGATPVLRSQAELEEYGSLLKHAEAKGWGLIGSLTQSMADANKLANRFDTPLIHASNLNSGSNSGGFAGKNIAALPWGKKTANQAAHLVHEITHVLTARKFGSHSDGSRFLRYAFKNSSLGGDGMKAVGNVYRSLYADDYSMQTFGRKYSELDAKAKGKVDERIGAEIFNDVISNNASKFAESGFFGKDLFPAFSEFRQRCFEAAIKGGLYTNEDLGVIDEFLEKGLVDDFADEVAEEQQNRESQQAEYDRQVAEYAKNNPQPDDAASPLYDPRAQSARTETVEGEEPEMVYWRGLGEGSFNEREDKRRARIEKDYRQSKGEDKEAQQRWYKEHPQEVSDVRVPQYARQLNRENMDRQLLEERDLDRGGVDVDAEDFDDAPPAKPALAPAPTEDRTERIPESSAEYIQQSRLTKDDFERREAEREGNEEAYRAEEAQAREEVEHDEAYQQHAADAAALEDVKKQYGEKVHGKLTELSKKLSGLVGSKRVASSGVQSYTGKDGTVHHSGANDVHEAISYNRGGRFIEGFADAFDSFTKGKSTFKDFANAYLDLNSAKQKSKGSYFYDKNFGEQMEKLRDAYEEGGPDVFDGKGRLRPKFAKHVEELATRITHRVELQQKMLDFREELNSMFDGMSEKDLRERKTVLGKALQIVEQMQLRPSAAFKYMANFDRKNGAAWYKLADMTRDATKAYINTYQFAQNYFQEVTERKDWNKFSEGNIKVKNVVPGLPYDKLSANMAVSFLKTLETEGAMEHIALNGLVEMAATEDEYYSGRNNRGFGNNERHSLKFDPISLETRKAIEDAKANHDDYALDQAMQRAYDELETVKSNLRKEIEGCEVAKAAYDASFAPIEYLKRALNKTSRAVWGSNVAVQDKFYWPLLAGGVRSSQELLNENNYGLNEQRFVQERTGGKGGIRIVSFTDGMQNYMQQSAHWSAYQQLSDTLQILSRPFAEGEVDSKGFGPMSSITQTLQNKYGKQWADWLSNYEDDLNGERGDKTDLASKALRGLRSNVAQGSLVLNGSVALKQAPSMLDFMGFLDADIVAKRFAKGFWRSAKHFNNNALIQTMEGYTRMLENRKAGYTTVEEGDATAAGRKGIGGKIVSKLPGWMTNWITKTDYRTVANGMLACADQVDKWIDQKKSDYDGLKKGSDAYYQAVADLFENAVMDTQPIYNKEYRADALRTNNELVRSLSMFSTQQTQNYNNLVESFGEYQAAKRNGSKEEIKAARSRFAQTVSGQVASQVMFAFLDGMAKVLLHKKKQYEDEEGNFDWSLFAAKNGYTFANSVLSTSWLGRQLSPIAMDVLTGQLNQRTGGKIPTSGLYYGTEEAALALVGDFFAAIKGFSDKPDLAAGKNLAFATSSLLGLPTRNVYNMLNSVATYGLDFDWGNSVGLDKLLGIENLPSLKGMNATNEDDFLSMLQKYYSAKPNTRGKLAMQKALAMMKAGNDWGKDAILSTIDKSDKDLVSAAENELKKQFIAGNIGVSEYRDILRTYFRKDNDSINELIESANEARRFNAVAAKVDGFESIDKRMQAYTWTSDRTGDRRMNEIFRFGIADRETDVMVQHYMGNKYYADYTTLRNAGLSPSKAHSVLTGIDTDGNSYGLSQDELWQRYKDRPRQEDYIELLWNSMGYTGKNTKDWDTYKEHQTKNGK